jgi:nonribosomal peptide synthetase DhbF
VNEVTAVSDQDLLESLAELIGLDPKHPSEKPFDICTIIEIARRTGHVLGILEVEQARRMLRLLRHSGELMSGHQPGRFDGTLLLFVATEGQSKALSPELWAAHVTGEIDVHGIACRHDDMTQPLPIAAIGRLLEQHLQVPKRQPLTGGIS